METQPGVPSGFPQEGEGQPPGSQGTGVQSLRKWRGRYSAQALTAGWWTAFHFIHDGQENAFLELLVAETVRAPLLKSMQSFHLALPRSIKSGAGCFACEICFTYLRER